MKKRKALMSFGVFAALTIGASTAVYANQDYYSFRLPSTGYMTTNAVTKTDDRDFKNNVGYTGKSERIDFWGVQSGNSASNNSTTESYFTDPGVKWAYYNNAATYNGKNLYMVIKTGPTTFTPVDVNGWFAP